MSCTRIQISGWLQPRIFNHWSSCWSFLLISWFNFWSVKCPRCHLIGKKQQILTFVAQTCEIVASNTRRTYQPIDRVVWKSTNWSFNLLLVYLFCAFHVEKTGNVTRETKFWLWRNELFFVIKQTSCDPSCVLEINTKHRSPPTSPNQVPGDIPLPGGELLVPIGQLNPRVGCRHHTQSV